jgi:5'(3')-deoxyribonucleotidase
MASPGPVAVHYLPRMRLGIDLDGVVANFTSGWMKFYNRQFGTDLVFEDSKKWNDLVDLTHFDDIDQFWEWSSNLEGRSLFWHLEPFPGAVEALHDLGADGHEIVILTQKPAFAIKDTHDWVRRHAIPSGEIHILDDKWAVDCDVYLDDGPLILPHLVSHRPNRVVCRYVRPWNQPVPGAVDVVDFDEFREVVDRRSQKLS